VLFQDDGLGGVLLLILFKLTLCTNCANSEHLGRLVADASIWLRIGELNIVTEVGYTKGRHMGLPLHFVW
jgi:hypothetical protein